MAYSYGRKYYKKKYGYKSYGRKKYYRKAPFYKQMRSINSGTSSTLVQVTRSGMLAFNFAQKSNTSNVFVVCPWGVPPATANIVTWTPVVASALYQTYAKIYDEVRLERMEISLSLARSLTAGSTTLMLYSAVDRKFTSVDTAQTIAQLTQASGVIVKNVQPASTTPLRRVVYPRDLQEKINYLDCSWGTNSSSNTQYLSAWNAAANNLSAFSPAFSLGLLSTVAATNATSVPYVMNIKYYLRFRNPKTELANASEPPIIDVEPSTSSVSRLNMDPAQNDVAVDESTIDVSTVK